VDLEEADFGRIFEDLVVMLRLETEAGSRRQGWETASRNLG
jgi:hypothetical protein